MMDFDINLVKNLLDASLQEDYGIAGDITSAALISKDQLAEFNIIANSDIILSGIGVVEYLFSQYSDVELSLNYRDAELVKEGFQILSGRGRAQEILKIERVALNYLQHMSGIATLTNEYVQKVKGTKAKICDTRKTIPMIRSLQKYAVRCGGGNNHRLALDSSILIKDNHIALCGGVAIAIERARASSPHYAKIEVECDSIEQVREAILYNAEIIMLDNMNLEQIKEAVAIIDGRAIIEASGNVSLDNITNIAKNGVDIISIGRLTHSAKAVDLSLNIL